jgi:restriction system protein
MAVPFFQDIMLPLLEAIADGQVHPLGSVRQAVALKLGLTESDLQEKDSWGDFLFAKRLRWAVLRLKRAGLLENPKRGFLKISGQGKKVLVDKPPKIDTKFLQQFPTYEQKHGESDQTETKLEEPETQKTPEELLKSSYAKLRESLSEELLEEVKACSPSFFEKLVVDLLEKMGYGTGQILGGAKDGGIDGIIRQDKLGLDWVCIQAKRWEGSVGRPVVQAFAGSMDGRRAHKGVLITTSSFSKDAKEYINHIGRTIVLIDGPTLADLMIDHGIGVSKDVEFILKKIDLDYFGEEEA